MLSKKRHSQDLHFRNAVADDHERVIEAMPEWWGGRDLTPSVLKIFFVHFQESSFIAETGDELAGFLVGFPSQTISNQGYIHFAGVNPSYRRRGVGRELYHLFFAFCRERGVFKVRSCTSPINTLSIQFHTGMGFSILPGDAVIDGVEVSHDFLKKGVPLVVFEKLLG